MRLDRQLEGKELGGGADHVDPVAHSQEDGEPLEGFQCNNVV